MSEKSYVSMEAAVCPACARKHQTGTILLDRRLRERLDRETVTHWAPCPEHQEMLDDGRVLLVEIDYEKSDKLPNGNVLPEGAYRLGAVAALKVDAFKRVFNVPVPEKRLAFVGSEIVAALERAAREAEG